MQLDEVRHELSVLWQSWLELVLAALVGSNARNTDNQAVALGRLQVLLQFLFVAPETAFSIAETVPRQQVGGISQLCDLLQCQAQLRHDDAVPTSDLRQQLHQCLLKVASACRHSDWTLAGCIATGLARQCRELAQLGTFAGDAALTHQLVTLEAQLLLWHAAPQPPSIAQQTLVQKQLLALTRGHADLCRILHLQASPPPQPVHALPADIAQEECAQLAALLQPALVPGACTTETLMFACYRLAWVLHAMGQLVVAEVGLLVYQLLVQHWQQRAHLLEPEQLLIAAWLKQVDLPGSVADQPDAGANRRFAGVQDLLSRLSDAVACWPGTPRGAGQSRQDGHEPDSPNLDNALFAVPAARNGKVPSIRHLPEYLAASLSVLLQVDAAWFSERSAWLRCADLLYDELQLLEQGAAALRLSELEQFCSLLLGVYVRLQANLPQAPWPGAILWRAHHELVLMLDRAALWLEPLPEADTVAVLRDCLQQDEERCMALLRAPHDAGPALRLSCAMALFGQQAGRLLGRPLRISFDAPAAMQGDFEPELLRTLQEILRYLLLQHESSAELRRSQRQTVATTLLITVLLPDDASCEVAVLETGVRTLPGGKALQRLQRSLGPAVEELCCEEVQRVGRRVQYRLSAASLQRALDQRYRGERRARQN